MIGASSSQQAFFIPIPAALGPLTPFACPAAGTVFTYDVLAWNTDRPNRMTAVEEHPFECRIKSDAQGVYGWFGGVGPHLDEADDAAEKKLIAELWPLRAGDTRSISKELPSRYGDLKYTVVAYGVAHVPAGLFWAYKIRKDYYTHAQHVLYHSTTLWWSPSLKWSLLQWIEKPGKPSQAGGLNWKLVSVTSGT